MWMMPMHQHVNKKSDYDYMIYDVQQNEYKIAYKWDSEESLPTYTRGVHYLLQLLP